MIRAAVAVGLALATVTSACRPAGDEAAVARGLAWFASEVEEVDPGWANLFGYLHRRFGVEAFSARGEPLHEVPDGRTRPGLAAVYRRLVDPAAAVPKRVIADLPTAVDRITASALHCDRIPLPPDWPEILDRATAKGGYALTHGALAAQWTLENGCLDWPELAAVQRRQVDALAALLSDRDGLEALVRTPTDLAAEALAMLHYLGARARVAPAWVDRLAAAQRPDGGWPLHPAAPRSDPHPTALALWVLLERARPEAAPVRWIPAR